MSRLATGLFLVALCISVHVYAQQKPQYTQYLFNSLLITPAVAGIERYADVKIGARSQWQEVEGAPRTFYLSAHMPIGRNYIQDGATSFPEGGYNPYSRGYSHRYRASEAHHGFGFMIQQDLAGQFKRSDVQLIYAYHLRIAETMNLSAGVNAGVAQVRFDVNEATTAMPLDPVLSQYAEANISPDVGVGLWLYGARFFFGLSAHQLIGNPLMPSSTRRYDAPAQQLYMTAGYKLHLGEDMAVVPSVLYKLLVGLPIIGDYNVKLAFRDRLWIGAGYRNNESFSAMVGFNVSSLLNLSYSYDFNTGPIRRLANGSHEIVLGLLLNNRFRVYCPQILF